MGLMGLMRLMRPMRPMRLIGPISPIIPIRLIRPIGFLSLLSLLSLSSCSSESEEEGLQVRERASAEVAGVTGCVTWFEDQVAATRAWTPPTGYSLYGDAERSISVFFTQPSGEPEGGYLEESFFKSSGKWRVSKTDLAAETYYLYGYVPKEDFADAHVTEPVDDSKTFADGAVLTIENLNAITPSDVCAIVGAKNGKDYYDADGDYSVEGLTRGDFAYAARTTSGVGSGNNYVYLLFEHLYAAFRIQVKVDAIYNRLRTIKLKEMHLQTIAGSTTTKKKTNVTVTLNKTADGSSPISSVDFTPQGTEEADGILFESAEGETLTTDYSDYLGHFMPKGITKLVVTSIYDVYDKNASEGHPEGNLIRQGCSATNTIVLEKLLTGQTEALRGRRYTVNMTIKPTYLYMLSEPDLDNPTMVVE